MVYTAFSEGVVAGIWHQLSLATLGLLIATNAALLAAVLAITTVAARRFGFARAQEITIVFCGSKKSLASGIPMATVLFPAHTLGLVVLPLMLFHQMQLMTCAWLACRYAASQPEHGETGSSECTAQPTPTGTAPPARTGRHRPDTNLHTTSVQTLLDSPRARQHPVTQSLPASAPSAARVNKRSTAGHDHPPRLPQVLTASARQRFCAPPPWPHRSDRAAITAPRPRR